MKKVFFAFVAVATLALASCNNAPATEETPAATEETATPAEEAAPAEEVAPAATDSVAVVPAATPAK